MNIVHEERDHATIAFLQWYVTEQVEEESNCETLLNQLKIINGEGNGVLMMDRELATRVFIPPVA
jgi:ferritin